MQLGDNVQTEGTGLMQDWKEGTLLTSAEVHMPLSFARRGGGVVVVVRDSGLLGKVWGSCLGMSGRANATVPCQVLAKLVNSCVCRTGDVTHVPESSGWLEPRGRNTPGTSGSKIQMWESAACGQYIIHRNR